ncbi:MAG TPA: glycoside hydrolase family 11 protein, partial [Cellvibrionaceae bacterium]|nr:glycoside hydrolase family 11 protein [Cellvibrionaceae bacterium]
MHTLIKTLRGLSFLGTCLLGLFINSAQAETFTQNTATGTRDGFYYDFWKSNGNASFTLEEPGRYTASWDRTTQEILGGLGWQGGSPTVVNYAGVFGDSSSSNQNMYLAYYGTLADRSGSFPRFIYAYIVESYGSYNPANCSGINLGTYQSDGASYQLRRCQTDGPSIPELLSSYHYYAVRSPRKGFGAISGTIT